MTLQRHVGFPVSDLFAGSSLGTSDLLTVLF